MSTQTEASRGRSPILHREAFTTSRLLEFCSKKELVAQTGHPVENWPLVILKELTDNAIDDAEEREIAPEISINVSTETGEITVADNGSGIPAEIIEGMLDYSVRISSREAYASPTRGAQGNAMKTLIAMPFALTGDRGETLIEAQGIAHRIVFDIDHLRQRPKITHRTAPSSVRTGTRVTIAWPHSASSILKDAETDFLQMADNFAWLNPHLRVRVEWDGCCRVDRLPSEPGWQKWRACDPTSAHWYDLPRFERYIAAHVSRDQDLGRDRTVREFIAELRGFAGSAKQKLVLDETGLARTLLSALFGSGGVADQDAMARLLAALQRRSRPVKPKDLGLIGRGHLLARFKKSGAREESFKYQISAGETDGLPWVVETAFAWCPVGANRRRIITGVNWSVGLGNPFRSFSRSGEGLESILADQRVTSREPVVILLHFAHPRPEYTDRGKTALIVPGGGGIAATFIGARR